MNDQTPGAADIPKPLAPGEDRSLQGFAGCSQSGFSSMGAGLSFEDSLPVPVLGQVTMSQEPVSGHARVPGPTVF